MDQAVGEQRGWGRGGGGAARVGERGSSGRVARVGERGWESSEGGGEGEGEQWESSEGEGEGVGE